MKKIKALAVILIIMFIFVGCIEKPDYNEIQVGKAYVAETPEFDSIIVKYKDGYTTTKAAYVAGVEEVVEKTVGKDKISVVKFAKDADVDALMDYYNSLSEVEYAEPDYIMKAFYTPNDTYYQYQWHMQQLDMPNAWDIEMGESSVKVAVIDTGVAYDLTDLAGTNFDLTNDYDYVNNDSDAYDDNAHGTHCTGTIAQTTGNSLGVTGMAPGVTILPMKVLSAEGSGSTTDIAEAIIDAADAGADVISMSLGGGSYSTTMVNALSYAYSAGVTIFAATGNDNGSVSYPAAYDSYVIAVGATDYNKDRAYYSNYGSSIDIVAPGGDTTVDESGDGYVDGVLQQTIAGYNESTGTTDYTPGYYFYQGTSMACPHAAGLAALLLSYDSSLTPAEVRAAMQNTAEDLGTSGWDQYFGYGLIDPVAALESLSGGSEDTEAPTVSITGPSTTATATINITVTATDNVGVTGYYVAEDDSSTPTSGWVTSAPTTFTLSSEGTHYVYAFAKDAAGNVSAYDYFTVTYTAGSGGSVHQTETITDTLTYNTNRTDTYTIEVAEGEINLDLSFSTNYSNDMDLFLYDPYGNEVASSEGTTSTESITYNVGTVSGTYTVKVYMYTISWWYRRRAISYILELDWYEPAD